MLRGRRRKSLGGDSRREAEAGRFPRAVKGRRRCAPIALTALLSPALSAAAPAEQPAAGSTDSRQWGREWSGRADLNLANSSGNSGSGSTGVTAEARREVGPFRFLLQGGMLRASSETVTREAVGAPDDFGVRRMVQSRVSADRTRLRARIWPAASTEGRFASFFATAGWERDAPAGVVARFDLAAGVARSLGAAEEGKGPPLLLATGISFARQRDEVEDPEAADDALGLRFDVRSERRVRGADLALEAASNWSLANRSDFRLDATGSAAFPLSRRLAFRASLQVLHDSQPALERIPLRAAPGGPTIGTVTAPRRRTDRILLIALTVNFPLADPDVP